MKHATAILMAAVSLSGCATVMNDSTHPVRFETKTEDGTLITGAECTASNDKGTSRFRSGETVQIRRSSKDLDVRCSYAGLPDASARATSRTNAAMFGNLLVGGLVGMVVDHTKGTAYTYPTWVQLIFGQTLGFDRRDEEDGKPVAGTLIERTSGIQTATVAPAPASRASNSPEAAAGISPDPDRRELDPAKRCDACKRLRAP